MHQVKMSDLRSGGQDHFVVQKNYDGKPLL